MRWFGSEEMKDEKMAARVGLERDVTNATGVAVASSGCWRIISGPKNGRCGPMTSAVSMVGGKSAGKYKQTA